MSKNSKDSVLTRAIFGAVYISIIILAIYFGGLILQGVFGVLALFMMMEFYQMFSKTDIKPNIFLGPFLGILLYIIGCYTISYPSLLSAGPYVLTMFVIFILVFVLIAGVELMRNTKHPILNIAVTLGGIAYIVVPMFIIALFDVTSPLANHERSVFPLLAIFMMVWSNDTFAYLTGKQFGKTKMTERISPNKTWEGFAGGLLFSVIMGVILAAFLNDQPFVQYGILGIIVAVFGTIGDLIESMFKRSLGLKDSGNIIPGHGGLLDRLDSILVVIPVSFIYYIIVLFD